jgi:DNA modification methylase
MADNKLFYGDNLDVLRRYVKDESVDLIYLDAPFNSRQDYNVLFAEKDGTQSSSQITAFEDTWEWNLDAERAYQEIVERGGTVSQAMQAFRHHRTCRPVITLWITGPLKPFLPAPRNDMIAARSCASRGCTLI